MVQKISVIYIMLLCISVSAIPEELTPENLLNLKQISEFAISPDGSKILMVINTPNIEENSSVSDLYLMPFNGGEPKKISSSGKHNHSAVWSPDGNKIAFISDRDKTPQAYILDLNLGGEAHKATDMENGVANLGWSPDGQHLSFTSDIKLDSALDEIYPGLKDAKAYLYDDLPVRHWDVWLDEFYSHLFIMNIKTGEITDLTRGEKFDVPLKPFGGREQIAWSPDGSELAYTSKKVDDPEWSTNSDIYIYSIQDKNTINITKGMEGFDMDPKYSPDGRFIAFHSRERAGFESDRVRLMLFDRSNVEIRELSSELDQWVGHTIWAPDSRMLYFNAGNNDGTYQIYKIAAESGRYDVITSGDYNFGTRGIDISPDGNTLLFNRESINDSPELYMLPVVGGTPSKITGINDDLMEMIDRVKIEAKWITSTDGKKVHTWVIYPQDFDPSKKYPMITYCQGGPQQMVSQYFSTGWSFLTMAHQGYIIAAPNRRGCPGFGQDWVDAISRDYGGMPMQDILAVTDSMASLPFVDENRLAAIGASAGGYAVFWLAGNHEGRFSAFISHCGMFNMVSKYGSTEELWFPNWDNGGPYWLPEHEGYYREASPHSYANKWDTPIFIIAGEKDYRVPYTQSLEAFTVAQVKGIPSKLLVYPEENHWVLHPQEKVLWYREFFKFLDKYCKSK